MRLKKDLWSKIADGVGSVATVSIIYFADTFVSRAFLQLLGGPGGMTYGIILIGLSAFCLDRSVTQRYSIPKQAWNGLIGGALGWLAFVRAIKLGFPGYPGLTGFLIILMMGIFGFVLWRQVPFAGLKFFWAIFQINFLVNLISVNIAIWSDNLKFIETSWQILGYICFPAWMIAAGWMFYYTDKRVQRLWFGIIQWFLILLATSIFFGNTQLFSFL